MNETAEHSVSSVKETAAEMSETFFNKVVGISEAASITGRSKGQIGRDSNTKRLVSTTDEKGQKRYKVADLYQLYGFRRPKETEPEVEKRPEENSTETAVKLAVLEAELKAKTEALRRMEDENQDLRQTRDKLLEQNSRLTLLLPAPTSQTAPPELEPIRSVAPVEPKSFWKRLFT